MEGMSHINTNRQCSYLLDCEGVCSVFPRMAIGKILADKDFGKLLLASSIPLRKQSCDTGGWEIFGKLQEVYGGRDIWNLRI